VVKWLVSAAAVAAMIAVALPAMTAPWPGSPQGTTGVTWTAAAAAEQADTSPGARSPSPSDAVAARVPLGDAVADLEPADVWQAFYELTRIPRASRHEEGVRQLLVALGQGLGLETIVDDVGNVIIRKPAAPGMEGRHGVVLQAHMDMVPLVAPGKDVDLGTDPIEAYLDGDWVVADGTTLGADDGSGVALAMGVLQRDVPLGPIEALFTVNEEAGMDGASGLQPGVLQGDILINLDSETEGEFTIGSAGGEGATAAASFPLVAVAPGMTSYTLTVAGLHGGHSGVDIDKGFGHATKLLVRLLRELSDSHDLGLAELHGGTADNAIPSTASAVVVVPAADGAAVGSEVQAYQATLRDELAVADRGVTVTIAPAQVPSRVLDESARDRVIDVLYATPQGVLRMSDTVDGLVETSANMGIVDLAGGALSIRSLMRSSVDTELQDVHQMMASAWRLAGLETTFGGLYGGWQPDPDSPILVLMEDVYQDLYGHAPAVTAVHAGLEAGTIMSKYPGMDAISIGPTLEAVHTVNERLQVATVERLDDLVMATLQRIPAR
jgi:dipeptidase D